MKTKDKKELQAKTVDELKIIAEQLKGEIFTMKMEKSLHKLSNTRRIFEKQKERARVLTYISGKELSK